MTADQRKVVGHYELVQQLGEGGMGVVHEARDRSTGRRYAIKLLHPELTDDEEAVARMTREARAAAAIGHPNIVVVHETGTSPDGVPYLLMEYLDGRNLGDWLKDHGQLPTPVAVAVTLQVLSALIAAHEKGIVHRDLKPANIFVTRTEEGGEQVKLLDFGVSKFLRASADSLQLTRTGTVMGTPYYMSPEQASGDKAVDERSDLWAVGVMLYQLLTGRYPFWAENYNKLIFQIVLNTPTRPRKLRSDLPDELEEVILKALEKDPTQRFQRAVDMIESLLPFYDRDQAEVGRFILSKTFFQSGSRRRVPEHTAQSDATSQDPAFAPTERSQPRLMPDLAERSMSPGEVVAKNGALDTSRRSRRVWTVGGVAVGLLAAGIGIGLLLNRSSAPSQKAPDRRDDPVTESSQNGDVARTASPTIMVPDKPIAAPPSPPQMPPPRPSPMPTTPAMVAQKKDATIRLVLRPPYARAILDGRRVSGTTLRLRRSGRLRRLTVTAKGYTPRTVTFRARQDQTVRVALRRIPEPRRPPPMVPPRRDTMSGDVYVTPP